MNLYLPRHERLYYKTGRNEFSKIAIGEPNLTLGKSLVVLLKRKNYSDVVYLETLQTSITIWNITR